MVLMWFIVVLAAVPAAASGFMGILEKAVATYHGERIEAERREGTYRGAAGILGISPRAAKAFGLRIYLDDDYRKAMDLFAKAEILQRKAVDYMKSGIADSEADPAVRGLAETAAAYHRVLAQAQALMVAYGDRLTPQNDARLNESVCNRLFRVLLEKALARTGRNLRDSLAVVYNRCKGIDSEPYPLNTQNVRFVNQVFNEFSKQATAEQKQDLDLDRLRPLGGPKGNFSCGNSLGSDASDLFQLMHSVLSEAGVSAGPAERLLFLALMRRESSFNVRAVSIMGAAGLTQIMPATALSQGMSSIFMPAYFTKARELLQVERRKRREGMAMMARIRKPSQTETARKAIRLMQDSLGAERTANRLMARYREELLRTQTDERFNPRMAIRYGFGYFSGILGRHDSDMSLALAGYNAGPHRVKQYQGIPPYRETVKFRNRVLQFYREYRTTFVNCRKQHARQ